MGISEHLHIEGKPLADNLGENSLQHLPPEKLQACLGITNREVKEHAKKEAVDEADQAPPLGVIHTGVRMPFAANDNIRIFAPLCFKKSDELARVQIQVAIQDDHILAGSALESGAESISLANILGVMNRLDRWIVRCSQANLRKRVIGAAVIHHDKIMVWGKRIQEFAYLGEIPADLRTLVVTRDNDRDFLRNAVHFNPSEGVGMLLDAPKDNTRWG
jgi:hypothetical protein